LFWICIDVIVVRVKVSRGNEPFSPMEIDSADTSQPLNEEICMDKSHLLPVVPLHLCTNRGGHVPIEAACTNIEAVCTNGVLLIRTQMCNAQKYW
jgi:hypothetical protein